MSERHWATIEADSIVIASGYCWCDEQPGTKHAIGIHP